MYLITNRYNILKSRKIPCRALFHLEHLPVICHSSGVQPPPIQTLQHTRYGENTVQTPLAMIRGICYLDIS